MADMAKTIPRDDSGSRHSGKMSREVIEQDFSAQGNAITALTQQIVALSKRVVFLETSYNPFAEFVFLASDENTGTELGLGREVYITPYDKFRLVIGEEGTDGADYDLQYYDGGWIEANASPFTAGSTDPICYHSAWTPIPPSMKAYDMALLRINIRSDVAGTLTTFLAVQFWDSSRGTPPESGGPLP